MASISRLRPLLRVPALLPSSHSQILHRTVLFHVTSAQCEEESSSRRRYIRFLPRFLQPSTYKPSYGKSSVEDKTCAKPKAAGSKPWNPATFFIWIFLLIGSQAIQQLQLKRDHADFVRKADTRIALLREVLDRLARNEDVDVERILGTGDPQEEKAWEEVLKEIEQDDVLWKARQMQKEAAAKAAEREVKDAARKRRQARSAEDYDIV